MRIRSFSVVSGLAGRVNYSSGLVGIGGQGSQRPNSVERRFGGGNASINLTLGMLLTPKSSSIGYELLLFDYGLSPAFSYSEIHLLQFRLNVKIGK